MPVQRINIQGIKDYTGVSLEEIISDLNEHKDTIGKSIAKLNKQKTGVQENHDRIDDSESINEYIEHVVSLFSGYTGDLERLLREMKNGVEDRHVEMLKQICESSKNESRYNNRGFKNEHIVRILKDESMRIVLDSIYETAGNQLTHNINLGGLGERLRTFIGFRKEELFGFKPNYHGFHINLRALWAKLKTYLGKRLQ